MSTRTDIRTVGELQAAIARGLSPKYLHFWGHTARRPGPGPHVLSQWWPAPFVVGCIGYATAEHYMMAEKARLFGDQTSLERILAAPKPGAAKALGRAVAGYDEAIWHRRRFDIVVAGSTAKFAQNAELGDYLTATGDKILVEASPLDRIWGIGLAADHADAENPSRWPGLNLLGFALMQARARLAAAR